MPLGTEVNLGPGDVVLDGVTAPPPPKSGTAPVFGSCLLWPNGCMDEDVTWYGSRPRREPSSSAKGDQQPPSFRPMLRSSISATAELLLKVEC